MPDSSDRTTEDSYSEDDKWLVVKGRRWRRTDPELESTVVEELKSHLGKARNAVRTTKKNGTEEELKQARHRVDIAKHGLGERGDYWWEMTLDNRRKRAEEALRELR
ncbi:biopolymer transporter Tol [Brevibacterium oceani]|uniref:biopolymer transporter Tol n=1 Tax=Brevibacterium oceani TaxID=358099 RepID=UPI001B31DDCD|nr:biopolymer transporter Tol [Brevibacterium oceani]